MNIVAFVGQIVELPKLRESAQGNKFATMVVRVGRPFPNSDGVYEQDDLTFTLWKGIAETTTQIANEGDQVAIKGRLQSHTFEGNDGLTHRSYDLIAENVSFLSKKEV
ncbi:single-stranded DNA-binding protein [Amedibacillus sp. YH-ame10]